MSPHKLSNQIHIKNYALQPLVGHSHDYHQITIPLMGDICTIINNHCLKVSYGQALIIPKNTYHQFYANKESKFLIVDVDRYSNSSNSSRSLNSSRRLADFKTYLHCLDAKTLLFIHFINKQLCCERNPKLEQIMLDLLTELLQSVNLHKTGDARLTPVIKLIQQDIAANYSIASLAQVACLSESQFKVVFKQQLGCTPFEYINERRMQSALDLTLNSTLPIGVVAQKCGYNSVSAFIRRFAKVYQQTPSKLRKNGNKVQTHY